MYSWGVCFCVGFYLLAVVVGLLSVALVLWGFIGLDFCVLVLNVFSGFRG